MPDDFFKDFDNQQKSMFKRFGVMAVIIVLVIVAAVLGIIYFLFWCMKHFNVI